ncbi:inositol 1,4,5-triphosphate receptor associated 2-like [Fundulus heteroclitus]|uniref:inositol 1,4,5-triphosphate receptor associated 2-like n=1 Tax=Fundulus heteroclitus TaxID=8078 RepID=UPI00165A351A|nr:inositol 1,4,5-triphosphate receptor associated 2-like [Fundulus heteroclitus]
MGEKSTIDSHDVPGSYSGGAGDTLQHSEDTDVFSEQELLDIMYDTCDASNTGEVLASCIMQYLQTLTVQSAEGDRLSSLRHLLDPHLQDPHVSRETFQSTMRMWIAQCRQDSSDVMCVPWPDYSEWSANAPPEGHHCSCGRQDLSGIVADLKRARRQLSEHNRSLLRMLAQCEDENLQLSLEITELQAELVSAQRSSVKGRSATEELEETRRTLKEVQETASHTQRRFSQLTAETERLRIHIRALEDKNEKLTFERAYAEESVDELKRVNTKLRAQHEETLTLMMLKDKEITKKNILMDKMKTFHVENHNMMEGLQSELRRLQEHSHRQLLRFDRQRATPQSFHSLGPPNQHSLQTETQNLQPVGIATAHILFFMWSYLTRIFVCSSLTEVEVTTAFQWSTHPEEISCASFAGSREMKHLISCCTANVHRRRGLSLAAGGNRQL